MFRGLLEQIAFAPDNGAGNGGGGGEGGEGTGSEKKDGAGDNATKVNFSDALKDEGFTTGLKGIFQGVLSELGIGKKEEKEPGKGEGEGTSGDGKPTDPEELKKQITADLQKEIQRQDVVKKAAKKKAGELNWPAQAITDIEDQIPTVDEKTAVAYIETLHSVANAIAEARFKGTDPGNPGDKGKGEGDPREQGRKDYENRYGKKQ